MKQALKVRISQDSCTDRPARRIPSLLPDMSLHLGRGRQWATAPFRYAYAADGQRHNEIGRNLMSVALLLRILQLCVDVLNSVAAACINGSMVSIKSRL